VSALRERTRRAVRLAGRVGFAALLMLVASHVALVTAFPYGGGEFHAIYAYGAHYRPAAIAFVVAIGTICVVAAIMVVRGSRLHPAAIALIASVLGWRYWSSVVTTPRREPSRAASWGRGSTPSR